MIAASGVPSSRRGNWARSDGHHADSAQAANVRGVPGREAVARDAVLVGRDERVRRLADDVRPHVHVPQQVRVAVLRGGVGARVPGAQADPVGPGQVLQRRGRMSIMAT